MEVRTEWLGFLGLISERGHREHVFLDITAFRRALSEWLMILTSVRVQAAMFLSIKVRWIVFVESFGQVIVLVEKNAEQWYTYSPCMMMVVSLEYTGDSCTDDDGSRAGNERLFTVGKRPAAHLGMFKIPPVIIEFVGS